MEEIKPSERIKEIEKFKLKSFGSQPLISWSELKCWCIIQYLDEQAAKCSERTTSEHKMGCGEPSKGELPIRCVKEELKGCDTYCVCPKCKPSDSACEHEAECKKCKRHIMITKEGETYTFPSTDMMNFMSGKQSDSSCEHDAKHSGGEKCIHEIQSVIVPGKGAYSVCIKCNKEFGDIKFSNSIGFEGIINELVHMNHDHQMGLELNNIHRIARFMCKQPKSNELVSLEYQEVLDCLIKARKKEWTFFDLATAICTKFGKPKVLSVEEIEKILNNFLFDAKHSGIATTPTIIAQAIHAAMLKG